jgi:alkanesulfonate monooxygenase SsuD/methylene tetrahydromethanopterin reductase-like flavin-dependent oxidoreductase (luciferase family)
MSRAPYVTNASDRDQVAAARRITAEQRRRFQAALKAVLSTYDGRLVLYRMLEVAGIFKSIYAPNAEIYYRAGRQDYGHELMVELADCDETLYLEMEREARQRARSDAEEAKAARVPRAGQEREGRDDT